MNKQIARCPYQCRNQSGGDSVVWVRYDRAPPTHSSQYLSGDSSAFSNSNERANTRARAYTHTHTHTHTHTQTDRHTHTHTHHPNNNTQNKQPNKSTHKTMLTPSKFGGRCRKAMLGVRHKIMVKTTTNDQCVSFSFL